MSAGELPEIIFTFKITHDAIVAERALNEAGVQVRVMSLPAQIAAGCGLCLRVWPEARGPATDVLARAGICPQGVWQKHTGGGQTRYTPC